MTCRSGRGREYPDLPMPGASVILGDVDPAKYYKRLVRDLDGWSSAAELAPGRIRVSVPQAGRGRRTVVIVMTPGEWEDMFTVAHGSFDSAFDRLKRTLVSMKPHEGFAVYADYGLEPSATETLPELVLPEPGSGAWAPDDRHGSGDGPKGPS